jgi:hypothetical protein
LLGERRCAAVGGGLDALGEVELHIRAFERFETAGKDQQTQDNGAAAHGVLVTHALGSPSIAKRAIGRKK